MEQIHLERARIDFMIDVKTRSDDRAVCGIKS